MYTVLKTKRCHFQIPKPNLQKSNQSIIQENHLSNGSKEIIVSSCFLDDVFILFLFKSGRFFIVKSISSPLISQAKKNKKSKTIETQIIYDGNILHKLQQQKGNIKFQEQKNFQSPNILNSKNSLEMIEESNSKVIFSDCKRIKVNECIIITRHSRNVYWLKISKHAVSNILDYSKAIRTQVFQLPGTMISHILEMSNAQVINNMTILTDLLEFNNSVGIKTHNQIKNFVNRQEDTTGSFYIKNEIIEDKMIYITFYSRIPQNIKQKYLVSMDQTQKQLRCMKKLWIPEFILTKFEFAIPVNEVSSNFVIEISDRFNNQITIYKQYEDDGMERQIKLYRFDFLSIEGERILKDWFIHDENKKNVLISKESPLVIENQSFLAKPVTIILPHEFTSSIRLQQFIRLDCGSVKNEKTYMIISTNQTFVQNVNNINHPAEGIGMIDANDQLLQLNNEGNLLHGQNIPNSNNCWVHTCRLTFFQNSDDFSQSIERLHNIHLNSTSFLKVININYEFDLMYVLGLAHQSVDGQLYQNKIDLISLKTGKVIQKGYCSLKNYSFSPNQKYILDVPSGFSTQTDYFYHVRLLFDKKSLYLFMIENSNKYFAPYRNVNFIETLLGLL